MAILHAREKEDHVAAQSPTSWVNRPTHWRLRRTLENHGYWVYIERTKKLKSGVRRGCGNHKACITQKKRDLQALTLPSSRFSACGPPASWKAGLYSPVTDPHGNPPWSVSLDTQKNFANPRHPFTQSSWPQRPTITEDKLKTWFWVGVLWIIP